MIPTNKPMDYGHAETDRQLKSLEKKLKKMYRQASQNAEEKFTTYMESFRKKDDKHRMDVETGKWTQKQYDDWRKNQLLYADTLQSIKETIADDLQNTDKMAIQMVREHQKDVYALNHNYGTYEVEHGAGVDTQYTLYDHDTVERLMRDDPKLLPPPSKKRQAEIDARDKKWNMDKLTSCFTASIVSGDSIPMMAKRISSVADMDRNSAIRNARTMTTGAENSGRIDSYLRAKAMGIDMKEEWVATLDGRTRHSHRNMDGEKIAVGEKFSNGLRFPGDPDGAPDEVDNCRCTIEAHLTGIDSKAIDKSDVLQRKYGNKDLTYEQWKNEHTSRKIAPKISIRPRKTDNVHQKTSKMTAEEYHEYKRELQELYSDGYDEITFEADEYAHVMSELNTHLSAEDRKHARVVKAIGNYLYTIINLGFDNYIVIGKEKIK